MTSEPRPPYRKFRTIRSSGGNWKTAYYLTKEARDKAGQTWADHDGTHVLGELWAVDHDHGPLNEGWACNAVFRPLIKLALKIDNIYEDGDRVVTEPVVMVPEPPRLDDADALDEWADEFILPATGTGKTEGDASYFVEVIAVDPSLLSTGKEHPLVGRKFEFGI